MSTSIDPKSLRKRLNWSQDQMAAYLGMNRSTVSRMESGGYVNGPAQRLLRVLQEAADAADQGDGSMLAGIEAELQPSPEAEAAE